MDGESGTADSRSAALPLPCMCLLVSRGGRGDARVRAYCRRLATRPGSEPILACDKLIHGDTALLIDSERFWGPFQRVLPSKFKHIARRAQHDACATKLTLSGERRVESNVTTFSRLCHPRAVGCGALWTTTRVRHCAWRRHPTESATAARCRRQPGCREAKRGSGAADGRDVVRRR